MSGPPPRDPRLDIPAWVAEDKGPVVLGWVCTFTALATVFCGMRLYTRQFIMGKLQLDDFFISAAVFCGLVSMALTIKTHQMGGGKHMSALLDQDPTGRALVMNIAAFTPAVESFLLPKLGVAALLIRLLNPGKWQRIFLWTLTITCFIAGSLCNVILFTNCNPPAAQWDVTVVRKPDSCRPGYVIVNYSIFAGLFSTLVDIYLSVYPAFVLFSLQLSLKKKIALSVALGLGLFAAAISVYKITQIPLLGDPDFSYATAELAIWTCIEADALIIAACIPVLQPLYERIFGHKFGGGSSMKYVAGSGPSAVTGGTKQRAPYADLEMQSGTTSSKRRGPRDPNALTFLDHDADSEEDILKKGSASMGSQTPIQSPREVYGAEKGGIKKTHVISVEYGTSPPNGDEKRWRRDF